MAKAETRTVRLVDTSDQTCAFYLTDASEETINGAIDFCKSEKEYGNDDFDINIILDYLKSQDCLCIKIPMETHFF